MSGNHLLSLVKNDLQRIEAAVAQNLSSHVPFVSKVSRYVLFSGGKRIRPLLMILAARICGYHGDHKFDLATVFEYLHAATLLHDDVVDNAEVRRGKPPAKNIYGNQEVILVGDFLYSKSLLLSTLQGNIRIVEALLKATTLMAEGEVLQLLNTDNLEIGEDEYMQVIYRKTAVLMAAACQVGAILGNVSAEEEEALRSYGENLGIAFQLTDDILDYTATTEEFGKKAGNDLREGKLTLPLIYTLNQSEKFDGQKIKGVLFQDDIDQEDFVTVRGLVEKYGGFGYTYARAQESSEKAKTNLAIFPPSPTKDLLLDLADYILARRK